MKLQFCKTYFYFIVVINCDENITFMAYGHDYMLYIPVVVIIIHIQVNTAGIALSYTYVKFVTFNMSIFVYNIIFK